MISGFHAHILMDEMMVIPILDGQITLNQPFPSISTGFLAQNSRHRRKPSSIHPTANTPPTPKIQRRMRFNPRPRWTQKTTGCQHTEKEEGVANKIGNTNKKSSAHIVMLQSKNPQVRFKKKNGVRYNLVKTSLALPHSRLLKTG